MKKISGIIILFLFLTTKGNSQTTLIDSIFHDGVWRNYRVYVPAIYTSATSVPLVLNLHGYTSNASQQEFYGDFRPIADTANFILVHPNGTGPSTAQWWNAYSTASPDDIGFLEALIDTLSLQYNINANRVYTCGMSNGGIMSYYLGCSLNYKFAAIGSVTGSMTPSMYTLCLPPDNMPVIEIHGTADATVPYLGSGTFKPIDSIIKFWASFNNCTMTPVVINYPDINTTDGCTATEYQYLNGTDGSEVVLVKINGGAHTWPDAPITIGVTNRDFDASVRLWQFFMQFDKSQFIGINELTLVANEFSIYPNPSSYLINMEVKNIGETVIINDLSGKVIQKYIVNSTKQIINVSGYCNGIYFISYKNKTLKFVKN